MNIDLIITCPICGTEHIVIVEEAEYATYIAGATAQVAFPMLTAAQREQIISHLCPKCQRTIFG